MKSSDLHAFARAAYLVQSEASGTWKDHPVSEVNVSDPRVGIQDGLMA